MLLRGRIKTDANSEIMPDMDGCRHVPSHLSMMKASDIGRWTTQTLKVLEQLTFAQTVQKPLHAASLSRDTTANKSATPESLTQTMTQRPSKQDLDPTAAD